MSGWEIIRKGQGPWTVYWAFGNSRALEYVAWSLESAEKYVKDANRDGMEIYVTESMA